MPLIFIRCCAGCKFYHPYDENNNAEGECTRADGEYSSEYVSADFDCDNYEEYEDD